MRQALRDWQLQNFDSGLLGEAELLHRAEKAHTTLYAYIRNPETYPLEAYLEASELAKAPSSDDHSQLVSLLESADSGIRYWGVLGLTSLNKPSDKEVLEPLLDDASHEVRAFAANALLRHGVSDKAIKALREMLGGDSYAILSVLNVIDWTGTGAEFQVPLEKLSSDTGYVGRMARHILKDSN
ncbi:HEAT repeat domain-containing protein [Rubritalea tangerina]|uniref:HEAT repeat domain-containing protein n=1 Tax=Rubritalea tangerina TaxID=430798 RepID=A0ABW4Z7F7_9BACT